MRETSGLIALTLGIALLSACSIESHRTDDEAESVQQAVGELVLTDAGFVFPSWEERVIYVLTNRARSDPQKQQKECTPGGYKACPWAEAADAGCYAPVSPLVWDLGLSRSARFHATYLSKGGLKLGHDNCCTLKTDVGTNGCDGDPACACNAGTQAGTCANGCSGAITNASTRISRFTTGYSGEIAHQYYSDPVEIFHGWVDELLPPLPPSTNCSMTANNGHRYLILKSAGPRIGAGHHKTATASCNSPYWVEDFGSGAATIPRIPGAVHYPKSGTATTSFTFWSNWYHSGGSLPTRSAVVINGNCRAMSLEFGTAQNGNFRYQGTVPAGCQSYYFLFVDSAGARVTYPTVGSMTVGAGTACANDYSATQVPADCEGGAGGGGGTGGGSSGTGGGSSGSGGGTSGTGGGASGTGGGSSGAGGGTSGTGGGASGTGGGTSGTGGGAAGSGGGASGTGGGATGTGGGTSGTGGGAAGSGGGASGTGGGTSGTGGGAGGTGGSTTGSGGGTSGRAGGCGCSAGTNELLFPLLAFSVLLARRRQAALRVAS